MTAPDRSSIRWLAFADSSTEAPRLLGELTAADRLTALATARTLWPQAGGLVVTAFLELSLLQAEERDQARRRPIRRYQSRLRWRPDGSEGGKP